MPDKNRTRHGDRIIKHDGSAVTVEQEVRNYYNEHRRSSWWWNGDRGHWPNFWMTMAQKFEMPIAQIKNIIGLNGITDRPLPEPMTEDQIRKRQEGRGDFLVELYHRRYANDIAWELHKKEKENS